MNIFETIGKVTTCVERFHSQYLADALTESLQGDDHTLFNRVWDLVTPAGWDSPELSKDVEVLSEVDLDGGRIDILIHSSAPHDRVVGIEVKTVEDSTEQGQLTRYLSGLESKFPGSQIQVAYLTPFNAREGGGDASSLPSVKEFKRLQKDCPGARHVSWLEIAAIPWDGNELWKQHGAYVREHISSDELRKRGVAQDRDLALFFGQEATRRFWERLCTLEIRHEGNRAHITLREQGNLHDVAETLVGALEILIDSEGVGRREHGDSFRNELRRKFLTSPYRVVHEALFGLAERYDWVWIQGTNDYGLRTRHGDHSSGVSLVTSNGPDSLFVQVRR